MNRQPRLSDCAPAGGSDSVPHAGACNLGANPARAGGPPGSTAWIALGLAWLSGAAALAHQVLWTRRLVDVLGASAGTFSKVIGAFFLGLALGAWFASRANGGRRSAWTRVAMAELGVAVLAAPMLFSATFADWAYQHAGVGAVMKVLLPVVLILPPAAAMGMVIPWMVRGLVTAPYGGSSPAVWLYALNTLGGVFGVLLVILELLPRLGLAGTSLAAIGLNLLAGIGAWCLGRSQSGEKMETPARTPANGLLPGLAKLLAFASGFLVVSLEVVFQHQLAQVTINSLFSSAMVLALVLAALAGAAAIVPRLVQWSQDAGNVLLAALAAAGLCCALQPFVLTGMRGGVSLLPYELAPLPYTWEVLKLGLLALCPVLLAAGLIFPLLIKGAASEGGRGVGLLFAWNGLGGWLGAELGQSLIAPVFGLWTSIVLIGGLYLALAGVVVLVQRRHGTAKRWLGWSMALGAATAGCGWMTRSLPQASLASHERLAALEVGREGVVATLECGPGDWRMLFNNSYTLGGSKAQFNQERQAHLPLLLHGRAKTVAALGVATGSTIAGATLHRSVERIDAVELSPIVLKHAHDFFGSFNREVFHDGRVSFVHEDARWVIAGARSRYDVVVGDLFLPWRTGEGRLFALEHFRNVKGALKPDGLFCQWLPMFQLTRPQFEAILRTFREVFPEVFLLRGDFYTELPVLGLVGGRRLDQCDWRDVEAACARLREAGETTDPLMRHAEGVAMMILGPAPVVPVGPLNTLANAWLEWDAGRNILGMRAPWFIGIPCAEYLRDVQRAGQLLLPEHLRSAHEAGQFFLTLELATKLELPELEALRSQVLDRLPASLRNDAKAEWHQWPMRIRPAAEGSAKGS